MDLFLQWKELKSRKIKQSQEILSSQFRQASESLGSESICPQVQHIWTQLQHIKGCRCCISVTLFGYNDLKEKQNRCNCYSHGSHEKSCAQRLNELL